MTTQSLQTVMDKLCHASRREYSNPYDALDWPGDFGEMDWFMSPELLSLYGDEAYAELSDIQKAKLSFYEAVNFFSLNIHGEKALTEGLAQRLYRKEALDWTRYLHHFLDEENKHMTYFGEFCLRYGKKIYADKKMVFHREYAPGEEDFLFFAKIMIFEELVDVYNLQMSKDERLVPVVRSINRLHHADETRHLAFGRQVVKELFTIYSPTWSPDVLSNVRNYLAGYLQATWKEYYNPEVYLDAGLSAPYELRNRAYRSARAIAHRQRVSQHCIRFLVDHQMLMEVPSL